MKDRLLNILLIFFLTLIILQFILPNPAKTPNPSNALSLIAASNGYVSPDIPQLTIKNDTDATVMIDTCRDLIIQKDYTTLSNIPPVFCKTLAIGARTSEKLDLSSLYKLFQTPGEYDFKINLDGKTFGTGVTGEVPGFFRNLFRTLFYAPIYNLFAFLIDILPGHSFGLAIILVTILIRILLLMPQHHILMNSKKMQAIQPKIKELQEKHKGDQAKIGMELMALYKSEQVNPLGSCLPLIIQMPLLIVLYWVVLGITDFSNYYYLYGVLTSFDISKIDTVFVGVDLLSIGGWVGAGLALLVGAAQWLQIKLSLPKDSDLKKLEKLEKKAVLEKK